MASGDLLFWAEARSALLPSTVFAQIDVITGGSTPAEQLTVLDFDAGATENADFIVPAMPPCYDGGGIKINVNLSMTSDNGGAHKVRVNAAIRRLDSGEAYTSSHSYDFNGVSITVPNATGKAVSGDITFTDGADMDSWAVGEPAIIRMQRQYDHADDDATGDMELRVISVYEV